VSDVVSPEIPDHDVKVTNTDVPAESVASGHPVSTTMNESVAVLTMQAAPYNLLDGQMIEAITAALQWARDRGARAVVLRSSLRHFSAGADLDKMLANADGNDGTLDWKMVELLQAFDAFPVPIVASVHGVCVGGGFASAKLGSVEVTVGLHPLMGGIQRLVQRAGLARGKEIAMLGRRYDAATFERWGVINKVVPDEQLESATMTIAQELAHGPTVCHGATKKLAAIAVSDGVAAADLAMPGIQRAVFQSQDFHTGVRSYREKGIGMARFEGR